MCVSFSQTLRRYVKPRVYIGPTSRTMAIPLSVASSVSSTVSSPPGLSPLTPTSSNGANPRIASRTGASGASQDPLDRVQKGLDSFSLGDRSPADIYEIADEEHVDPEFVYASAWHRPLSYDDSKSTFGNESVAESYPESRVTESLWGDDDIGEKKAAEPAILCKTHGLICKKGICRDYARQLREYNKAQGIVSGTHSNDGDGKKRGGRGEPRLVLHCDYISGLVPQAAGGDQIEIRLPPTVSLSSAAAVEARAHLRRMGMPRGEITKPTATMRVLTPRTCLLAPSSFLPML